MKKILALVICVCIALTLSVSVMAESSPENKVIVRKATATKSDSATAGDVPVQEDTFVEMADDGTITVTANDAYGIFVDWSVYKISEVTGTSATFKGASGAASVLNLATATQKATDAKQGVDYTIVSGSLTSRTMTVKPISRIAICGNYKNAAGQVLVTDPLSDSSVAGTPVDKSAHTGDLKVMYIALVMLAAAAVVFGAKRQLSK